MRAEPIRLTLWKEQTTWFYNDRVGESTTDEPKIYVGEEF
jgi:hypothetical protein